MVYSKGMKAKRHESKFPKFKSIIKWYCSHEEDANIVYALNICVTHKYTFCSLTDLFPCGTIRLKAFIDTNEIKNYINSLLVANLDNYILVNYDGIN